MEVDTLFDDDLVNRHLDAVLRASGSKLANYSVDKYLREMREAMRNALAEAVDYAAAKDLV